MSVSDYISIMLGVIFVLIITIMVEIVSTKNNKPGKKVRRILLILILVVISVGIAVTIYFFSARRGEERDLYNSFVAEAEFELQNQNYMEAAKIFHNAGSACYDIESQVYAMQNEGMCYMIYGLMSSDKTYLRNALSIYKSIWEDDKYKNTETYLVVAIDLCSLYRFLGYDCADSNWINTVQYIEENLSFEDINSIDLEDIPLMISAGVSICGYYDVALMASPGEFLFGKESQEKVIYYLSATTELETKYNKAMGSSFYNEVYFHLLYKMTSYIITNSFFCAGEIATREQVRSNLVEARAICEMAITTIGVDNEYQVINYIRLKRNVGKSYIFSAYIADNESEKESNMHKAYQELIFPFYWDNNEVIGELLVTANYALITGCCTETDIDTILKKCQLYSLDLHKNTDANQVIDADLNILTICSTILEQYESNRTEAYDLGHEIWLDLSTSFYNLLDDYQKKSIEDYSSIFG